MDRSSRREARDGRDDATPPAASRMVLPRAPKPGKNRRRSQPSQLPRPRQIADACGRALRRSAPGFVAAGAIAAVGFAVWGGHHFLTTSPRFAIEAIDVRGARDLSIDDVRARMPARTGDNIFVTDIDEQVAALEGDPWIARATVRRELPRTLVVEIEERRAAVVVDLDGLYLADAGGHPFKRVDPGTADATSAAGGDQLPVVTGLGRAAFVRDPIAGAAAIRGALDAIAAWGSRPAILSVDIDRRGGLTLHTRETGTAIRVGQVAHLHERLRRFDQAWSHLDAAERQRARAIHVDHDTRRDHVVVAFD
jgi:cell division protein FtsQ